MAFSYMSLLKVFFIICIYSTYFDYFLLYIILPIAWDKLAIILKDYIKAKNKALKDFS